MGKQDYFIEWEDAPELVPYFKVNRVSGEVRVRVDVERAKWRARSIGSDDLMSVVID